MAPLWGCCAVIQLSHSALWWPSCCGRWWAGWGWESIMHFPQGSLSLSWQWSLYSVSMSARKPIYNVRNAFWLTQVVNLGKRSLVWTSYRFANKHVVNSNTLTLSNSNTWNSCSLVRCCMWLPATGLHWQHCFVDKAPVRWFSFKSTRSRLFILWDTSPDLQDKETSSFLFVCSL